MNRPWQTGLFAIALATSSVGAVAWTVLSEDFPKGTISSEQGGVKWSIEFRDGGKFTVSRGDEAVVKGTYKVDKDEIEFTDEEGPLAGAGDAKTGTYKWKRDGKRITFTKVEDEGQGRAMALTTGSWTLKD